MVFSKKKKVISLTLGGKCVYEDCRALMSHRSHLQTSTSAFERGSINPCLGQFMRSKNGFSPEAFLKSSTSAQNFSVLCFQPNIMFEKY